MLNRARSNRLLAADAPVSKRVVFLSRDEVDLRIDLEVIVPVDDQSN
jgi:hypothetical protein